MIVEAVHTSDMSMKCIFKSWNIDSDNTLYLFVSDLNSNI